MANLKSRSLTILLIFSFTLGLIHCIGGGGVGDTGVIEGTVVQPDDVDNGNSEDTPLDDVEVCCFGECDTTDEDGFFSFGAVVDDFPGGEVLCDVHSLGENPFDFQIVVPGLVPNPDFVTIKFTVDGANISATILNQATNGAPSEEPGAPEATPTFDPGSPEPEPTTVPSPEGTPTPPVEEEPTPEPTTEPEPVGTVPPTPSTGCAALSGQYSGNGGCGFGTTITASTSGGTVTLTSLGVNGPTDFTVQSNSSSAKSVSTNLTLFNKPGHKCTLTCSDATAASFTLSCSSSTGSCSEVFS